MLKTEPTPAAAKKLSPFEIADNVHGKGARLNATEVGYDAFMMGRICANNRGDVFFAAEMNRFPGISKEMSYRFYYEALDKGRRNGRWHKPAKVEEIGIIASAYRVNRLRAAQYHRILGEAGVAAVIASQAVGGKKGARKAGGKG